jgi:hypothetical protein
MARKGFFRTILLISSVVLSAQAVFAQSTGSISGRVTTPTGEALPGVTVEARSPSLPQARVTTTDANGDYRLPALQPGSYQLTVSLSGMQTVVRKAEALLSQNTTADIKLGVQGVSESITVVAQSSVVDRESTEIKSSLSNQQIQGLPVAHDYRDVQKLIPGVQLTQDVTRGPSAGGSGQDNVYLFDGVNVTMPLFGVLVAEPATHDIEQVTVIKGGAKAIDFERAGGFQIDSVSKSGTNKFAGEVEYELLSHNFVASQAGTVNATFQNDKNWSTIDLGGPIFQDRLFVYGSYYRPVVTRDNQANLTGPLPQFKSTRNEEFGKLTYTPTSSILINGSYRDSHRIDTSGDAFGTKAAGTTGTGFETRLKIGTLEGSWVMNPNSFSTFKFTNFSNPGFGRPDNIVGTPISTAVGTHLDLNSLAQLGLLTVPTALANNAGQAAFVQPFINKYGYLVNGVPTGGGTVGFGSLLNNADNFGRKNGQIGYNYTLGSKVTHDLHFGYQRYVDSEDLFRSSNGFGSITIPGGTVNCPASACGTIKPAFFQATLQQQSAGNVPTIHSEFHSQSFELNDTIHRNNWTFNIGVLDSNDTLFGQGLARADNIAGFVKSPGTKYEMHDVGFSKLIQPRLGATWAYNGTDTVYASVARYNQAANSDARAASWDRNLVNTINAYFDANGNLLGVDPDKSSSGKLFQAGIKPPETKELMIGTAQQISSRWSGRLYGRYKKGDHYWEDTNNNARLAFNPPAGVPQQLYIPNLPALDAAIGSGSSYVIANLDGAFTKYYEASMESEWHGDKFLIRGSYTWSHYYGNFDQDNSTSSVNNDAAIFIGSSNIGDGAGRQLWNNKYGNLRGDRRNVAKILGTYTLPWQSSIGAFFIFQSGQPYQLESFLPYTGLTSSTSDTNRYAEPAGSRTTPPHHQLDLKYTQSIPMGRGLNLQLVADVFNVYNNQSGYNFETRVGTLGKCNTANCIATGLAAQPSVNAPSAQTFYAPRQFQLAAKVQF